MKPDKNDLQCTVIIPIRRARVQPSELHEFTDYLQMLSQAGCEVLVVDGSPPPVFERHEQVWGGACCHVAPDPKYTYLNGKVNGVHTGVDLASCERIIVADDDIRYRAEDLKWMCHLLDGFEMVRPQNYISPLPWWARLETARILINRASLRAGDYPGTCGFRRSTMRRVGPYDGDVLFDNEEIVRHFAVRGANIKYATDFFILKRPPTFKKWIEQRPRQAYEDFVMRAKTVAFLSVLPVTMAITVWLGRRAGLLFLAVLFLASVLLSTGGLLRDSAYRVFPVTSPLFAPLWIVERSISVYWALYWKLRHRGYPFGERLLSKGTGHAWIAGGQIQSQVLAKRRGRRFTEQENA
ncbi:MAG: glycosyltransferase [Acidobacteriota bacterium]